MADNWMALYVAYAIVWIGLFAYITFIYIRQRSVEKDLSSLEQLVEKNAK